jgi:uncharacterized membrane protein
MMLVPMILALVSACAGCALLALSQARHWQAVTASPSPPPRALRRVGWSLVLASLMLCILRDGASFAALLWPLLMMAGALIAALLLAWWPAALRPLCRLMVPSSGIRRQ